MTTNIDSDTLAKLRHDCNMSAHCFSEAMQAIAQAAEAEPTYDDLRRIAETAQAATFALSALTEYIQIASRCDRETVILFSPYSH